MAGRRSHAFEILQREPPLSERVATRILAVITERQLRPGDPLPSERELAAQFGVSRTVIREGVRSLVGRGVLKVHAGRGLEVAAVDHSALREPMNLFLRARPTLDYAKVHEIRRLLEVEVAALAAERATRADIKRLEETCETLQSAASVEEMSQADVEFHRCLAAATHNDLFLVMLDAIGDPLMRVRLLTFDMPGRLDRACEAHERLVERIRSGDSSGARAEMQDHLADVKEMWAQYSASVAAEGRPTGSEAHDPAWPEVNDLELRATLQIRDSAT